MAARVLVAVAVVTIAAIVVLYLSIIRSQGGPPSDTPWVVPFVAGYEVLMALLLSASLLVPPALRPALRGAASAGLFVLGALAASSIGLGDIMVAAFAMAATVLAVLASPGGRNWVPAAAGAVPAPAALFGGVQSARSAAHCPA